jgi:hypothetical protein
MNLSLSEFDINSQVSGDSIFQSMLISGMLLNAASEKVRGKKGNAIPVTGRGGP